MRGDNQHTTTLREPHTGPCTESAWNPRVKDQSVDEQAYYDVHQNDDGYVLQRFKRMTHKQQIEFLYNSTNAFACAQLIGSDSGSTVWFLVVGR